MLKLIEDIIDSTEGFRSVKLLDKDTIREIQLQLSTYPYVKMCNLYYNNPSNFLYDQVDEFIGTTANLKSEIKIELRTFPIKSDDSYVIVSKFESEIIYNLIHISELVRYDTILVFSKNKLEVGH